MSSRADPVKPYAWKPGVSGNPAGRPKLPEDIIQARKISQFEFERIVNRYLFISPDEVKKDLERPDATSFEHILGGIIQNAIHTKDEKKAEWLIARTLGKMREKLDIGVNSVKVNVNATAALPTVEQLALENPDLSPIQVQAFADKLAQLKQEIAATKKFEENIIDVPQLEAPDE